ncbi:unnamed protein product [Anisakis simplex]|uniref:Phospholipid-transporting ATPase n=1 Tax=Anisakis simplex TaxID=6269 RepID=A0A3P6RTT8_ANISI|nr:unnamed protein product [Anisakis simplex]
MIEREVIVLSVVLKEDIGHINVASTSKQAGEIPSNRNNSADLPTVRPYTTVKHPEKPLELNWRMKISELLSRCGGGGSGKRGKRRISQPAVETQRHLRANDRKFNEQFKYADNFIKTSKYNVVTFLPKNLFEQFQRLANFYFLVLMVLQLIPWISSIVWYSTAIPLFGVLAFSAAKDAYDDIQRHRSDSQVNSRVSYVVRNGQLVEEKWMNVKVGDIIRMENDQFVAARQALPETYEMGDKLNLIGDFRGSFHVLLTENCFVSTTLQHSLVNEFSALFDLPLSFMIMHCQYFFNISGRETKLMMNSGKTKFKRTSLDRFLNILIMGIVLFLISMCLMCTILCGVWEWTTGRHFTIYLEWDRSIVPRADEKSSQQIAIIAFLNFFSYIILLNTVVPISLYVSDKTGTLTQNIMAFNKCSINGRCYGDLYDARGELVDITETTPCIDFSKNKWYEPNFKFYDQTLVDDINKGLHEVAEFWRLLALCHTVMPERKNGKLEYQAQSPDEAALTSAARNFGFVFKSRTANSITIEVNGVEEHYELLCILDFNNVRKRMSVIVRNSADEILLYCKGADTMILERISPNTNELLRNATVQHLDKFAGDGLRTLCVAYKKLDADYFSDWRNRQKEAALEIFNRQEKLDAIYEEIEKDMTLLGATAIEDKLQDGVPETIAKLASANIKIWVLTGDKQETAINIGYSCRLLTESMREVFVIDGETESEVTVQLKAVKRRLEETLGADIVRGGGEHNIRLAQTDIAFIHPPDGITKNDINEKRNPIGESGIGNGTTLKEDDDGEGFGLVINGHSLTHALKRNLEKTFLDIGCICQAVVCCRVTPLQKAMVVDLVKRNKKAVTLSVGDGANDVSMIKTAHIGVGISGQEGMQAVLASDYSIGQFRYLQRLLLVHGRWSYFRMAKFLRYFFYKNFSFTLTHFWYSFFCGYSAQTVYDPVFIASYNLFFTALPVLAMGVFDQDLDDVQSIKYAKLYMPGQYNLFFNMRIFIYSVLHGIISSLVIFFIPYGAMYDGVDSSGRDMNSYSFLAFTCFTALIIVVNGQIMFDTAYWTAFSHIVIWGSLLFYFGVAFIIYEALPANVVATSQSSISYGIAFEAMSTPQFWLCLLMISVILLLPVMANRFFWFDTHPSYADRLRMYNKLPKSVREEKTEVPMKPFVRSTGARRSRRSLRSGYAFSHQQGFGDLIVKGKLFKQIDHLKRFHISVPFQFYEELVHFYPASVSLSQYIILNITACSDKETSNVQSSLLTAPEHPPGHNNSSIDDMSQYPERQRHHNTEPKHENIEARCAYSGTPQSGAVSTGPEETAYQHNIVVNADEECVKYLSSFFENVLVDHQSKGDGIAHARLLPTLNQRPQQVLRFDDLPNIPTTHDRNHSLRVPIRDPTDSTKTSDGLSRPLFSRKTTRETEV